MDWKDYFSEQVLEKSKSITKNKIKMIKEDEHYYYAKIHGTVLYDLMLSKDYKKISCTCPYIDSGRRCKHMAFFLRYINRNCKKIDINVVSNDYLQIDFDFKNNKLKSIVVDNDELINFIVYNTGLKEELVQECIDLENKFLKEKGLIVEDVKDLNKDDSSNIVIENEEVAKYIIKHKQTDLTQEDIFSCLDYEAEYLRYLGVIRENESGETIIAVNYEKLKYDKEYIINVLKNRGLQFFSKTNKDIKNDLEFIKHLIELFGYDILKYCNSSILKQFRDDKNFEKHINSLPTKTFNPQIKTLTGLWGEQYNDNEEQALYIIKNYNNAEFCNVSERLKNDKNFVLQIMQINGLLLEYLNDKFKDDNDIVFTAVKDNRLAFQYASERLRNNKELALLALKYDGQPFSDVGDSLKNDRDVIMAAVENFGVSLDYSISEELRDDKEIILKAVEKNPWNLAAATERLKDDKEVVLTAIKRNFASLEAASERLRNDEDIAIHMVKHDNDLNFCYVCEKYYYDDELKNHNCPSCLGKVYRETIYKEYDYLGNKLAYNEKFINVLKLESFKHLTEILNTINEEITDNEFFMKEMVKIDDRLFSFASLKLLNNIEFVKFAIDRKIQNIIYAGYNILIDENFISNNIKDEVVLKKIKALKEYYNKENESFKNKYKTNDDFHVKLITKELNKFNRISEEFEVGFELYQFLLKNKYLEIYNISKIDIKKISTRDEKIVSDLKFLQNKIKIKEEERYEQYRKNK